jgi:4-diphosphocytidyl-2-C-methyl-D-erythritol kinase
LKLIFWRQHNVGAFFMSIICKSPAKINLLLNILGKRSDGFHDLETIILPIALYDELEFRKTRGSILLKCSDATLPVDASNLVYQAAVKFLSQAKITDGVAIDLDKQIPREAGLGGGSSNAAATLSSLNQLFDFPLSDKQLHQLAAEIGSDVPCFLKDTPVLARGRGELLESLSFFKSLQGKWIVLARPGFGISTAWAYKALSNFPEMLAGKAGMARTLASKLSAGLPQDLKESLFNSLEAPVFHKYPLLRLIKDCCLDFGCLAALMSGSGSTSFALLNDFSQAQKLEKRLSSEFTESLWIKSIPIQNTPI